MSFFKSLGHFFKHIGHALFVGGQAALKYEPLAVGIAQAAGAGHFLERPLEAQALITSIVGDIIDARHAVLQGPTAAAQGTLTIATDVVAKVDQLVALVKAHPEAPK